MSRLAWYERIATYLGGEGGFYVSRPGGGAPIAHATSHQDAGSDEISVTGLAGLLATAQTPAAHASSHQHGGADQVATATAAANAIPKAGAGGTLDAAWIPAGVSSMRQLYLNTVAGAAVTSWSVATGLAGDTDLIYLIRFYLVEAQLNTVLGITFNNDTGANYGYTAVSNTLTTVSGTRSVDQANVPLAFVNAAGHTAFGFLWMYAKTGFVRQGTVQFCEQVTATVPTTMGTRQFLWENTADNITRIDVTSTIAGGIGIGSSLEIWSLRV